jgi:hypothetical protein
MHDDSCSGMLSLVMLLLLQEAFVGGSSSRVQVLDLSKASDVPPKATMHASSRHCAQDSHAPKPRPWLMPHQLGDWKQARSAGRKEARAVNSRRLPMGGFAVLDLPPKF